MFEKVIARGLFLSAFLLSALGAQASDPTFISQMNVDSRSAITADELTRARDFVEFKNFLDQRYQRSFSAEEIAGMITAEDVQQFKKQADIANVAHGGSPNCTC
jgi:hypothetical protein